MCVEGEFPCTYQKCIRIEFKCDGDNDCGDWSDEDDCQKTVTSCSTGQFRYETKTVISVIVLNRTSDQVQQW